MSNHESPLRGSNFVTRKIVDKALEISNNRQLTLELVILILSEIGVGSEFVQAMHQIWLDSPEDFIVATGISVSLRDLVEAAFSYHNLDYREFVSCNNDFVDNEPEKSLILASLNNIFIGIH